MGLIMSEARFVLQPRHLMEIFGMNSNDATMWSVMIQKAADQFEINNRLRMAMFLAQVGHESGHFKRLTENLNYSAKRLREVFPKYFPTDAMAAKYARNPEMIANRTYGGRMGNGDEVSGDGYRYRGRGLIQLTGKDNYRRASSSIGIDLVKQPDLVSQPEVACLTAAWFWFTNGCNAMADGDQITNCTKRINGGTIGLDDRKALWNKALRVLKI